MIHKITYIESNQTNPYRNLALEEYLLLHVEEDECILYLWQNRHTVVIGKNQNAWKECKIEQLEQEGGCLVRRLSGGGAVFHDLGNLNFTFLVRQEDYSVEKQIDVILKAVQSLGVHAEKSGRNDLTIDGRKFSGNAFYETQGRCYHHGTIMVQVNMQDLSRYLNVSKEKLQSKGVDSVRSRVANLTDFNPDITIEMLKKKLIEAFVEVYGLHPQPYPSEKIDESETSLAETRFSSWDWIFGRKIQFSYELSHRFDWGDLSLQLSVNGGYIRDAVAFSDSLHPALIARMPAVLTGTIYGRQAVCDAILQLQSEFRLPEEQKIITDTCLFLQGQDF